MYKHKGDYLLALKKLKNDKNNAVAFLYKNVTNKNNVVITIKDLFATKNKPTQSSSKILTNFQPGYDATVVKKIRSVGSIVAKTHMDELALGGTGTFSSFGIIKNPLDKMRKIGGSSSGAAATMIDEVTVAIGSDTGDSIRKPASFVGKVGFKPSYGLVSRYGMFAFASSLDTVGWITHNVHDAIETSKILYGKDQKDMTTVDKEIKFEYKPTKPKKVAILKLDEYKYLDKQVNKLKNKFKENKILVEEVNIPKKILESIVTVYEVVSFSEASSNNLNLNGIAFGNKVSKNSWTQSMTQTRKLGFGPMVQRRFILGSYFLLKNNQVEIFEKSQKVRRIIKNEFNKILENYDVMIYPSATIAPKLKDDSENIYSSFLAYANLIGNPSITIPYFKHNDMPIGLSIDGQIYSDSKLLSNSLYIEKLIKEIDNV